MPTFRGLATYADGIPGATDRLLFETSGGAPRGVAPSSMLGSPLATDIFIASDANVAITAPGARSGVLFNQTLTLTANRNVDIAISAGWNRMYTVWHQAAGGFTVTVRLENPASPGNYVAALTAPLVVDEVALFVIRGDGFAETIYQGPQVTLASGDFNGVAVVDYTQPHVAGVSGTLTQAAHGGRPIHITGNVTVPVINGFVCEIRNKAATPRTITPASGSLIHDGVILPAVPAVGSSITLPQNRAVTVIGDGTDVWVYGALAGSVTAPTITGITATDTGITHSASGAVTLDLNSGANSYFDVNITGASANITGFTISEAATAGVGFMTVRIVNSSGGIRTITWGAFLWTNGITPATSLANGAALTFSAQSWNNGSTWYASLFGRDFA